jgi:hypothetical protein
LHAFHETQKPRIACHYTMFIRFRTTPTRLEASIVETFRVPRVHGAVRQRHLASLGSIPHHASPQDRIAFWRRVNAKLNALSNRIDAATQAKLRGEIHALTPMPTIQDQHEVQKANAQADVKCWQALQDLHAADAEGHRAIASKAARLAADHEARADEAKQKAAAASDRLAKLERGQEVSGGLGKPATFDAIAKAAGLTAADLRLMGRLGEIPEHEFETILLPRLRQASDRADRATINAVWRETARRRKTGCTGPT